MSCCGVANAMTLAVQVKKPSSISATSAHSNDVTERRVCLAFYR
jgi:hypothetical protein